jgi:hypothetical protein
MKSSTFIIGKSGRTMGSSVIVELLPAVHDVQQKKKICYSKMKFKIKVTTHCISFITVAFTFVHFTQENCISI